MRKIPGKVIAIFVKILIFSILSSVILTIANVPVITIELALGQMERSNELFLLWEVFQKMKGYVYIAYGLVSVWFLYYVSMSIYKLVSSKKVESEKE